MIGWHSTTDMHKIPVFKPLVDELFKMQIEMYLISNKSQSVEFPVLNETIQLQQGEKILTEISRKHTKSSILQLLINSGLTEKHHFELENHYFSLVLAKRAS